MHITVYNNTSTLHPIFENVKKNHNALDELLTTVFVQYALKLPGQISSIHVTVVICQL